MIIRQIRNFIRQAARDRLVRRVSSVLACLVVFVTAYMLILPAITLSGQHPVLEAEECSAMAGETLTVRVRAEAPEGAGDRIVTLVMDSGNAGLSERYVFDEDGTTAVADTAGQEIFLHRSARTDRADVIDYWFELAAGETAEFDLELQDRISVEEITEAARQAGFLTPEGTLEPDHASASDAETAEEKAEKTTEKTTEETAASAGTATSSEAEKTAVQKNVAEKAAAKKTVAEKTAAEKTASSSNAKRIFREKTDEDGALPDGEVLNDLEKNTEAAAAEITASLLVRAGSGDTLQAAVRDAEKNAEKRGDGSAEFCWKAEISCEFLKAVFRKSILAGDGKTYQVTVTYGIDAGVPEGSELNVSEIVKEASSSDAASSDVSYDDYVSRAERALGFEEGSASHVRLFDIRIVDGNGEKVTIQAPVSVEIVLTGGDVVTAASPETQVVHFADDAEVPDVVRDVEIAEADQERESMALTFDASGFSVYAIVEAPEEKESGRQEVDSLAKVASRGPLGFYVDHRASGLYLTGGIVTNVSGNSDRTGLETMTAASADEIPSEAALFCFEQAGDEENKFRVYTMENGQRQYVRMTTVAGNKHRAGLGLTGEENQSTVFTLELSTTEVSGHPTFRLSARVGGTVYYWNKNTNKPGVGAIVGYDGAGDKNTAWVRLQYELPAEDDPYGLNGKSCGIAYHNEAATSAALTAEPKTVASGGTEQQRLAGLSMLMKPDVLTNDGILLVAEGSDIQEWTFVSVKEDKYYITASVGGQTKYLTIRGGNVTLEDTPDETASVIRAVPGNAATAGKWRFTVNGYSLTFQGSAANGFNGAAGSGDTAWLNLVEKSVLDEDDFRQYTAKKVSVSDTENVYNGQQVVIYTRVWNETAKRYEFYAVDHDGSLIRCYDTGDGIEWVGTQVNTALWNFTEYQNPDGTPSYYYELENDQYGGYIAPQVSKGQILSGGTIGINLNGRRYGESHTTIIAWDRSQYSYSGLKVEDGRVAACPLSEADTFYFAVVNPIDTEDRLTEVETIDSDSYGITMKMVDFNNAEHWSSSTSRDPVQNPFFGGDNNNPGLLSTDIGDDGYPVTTAVTGKAGHSLGELFTDMTPVNNLFIRSIYNESGYFEYDSTSNFAHLNEDGNFTVYNQLGAIGDYGSGATGTHGQFMPYDVLTPGKYCTFTNQTDVLAKPLADLDARKGEKLYNIGLRTEVDYFFGMEMSAEFTQTPSGLDAWGHDIIFEFSGDDDFWFYVDDELVLDLGGVHSAMTGSINFRTGEVKSSRGNSTLYEIFRKNYRARGMTDAEISALLEEKFETKTVGGKTVHVFRDYTKHTMKMFYMERGAGASNLHMRFNLAAVKPGTVTLSKTLSGTESPSNSLIEFPYQIVYKTKKDGEAAWHLLGEEAGDADLVTYKDSTRTVPCRHPFSVGAASYDHVFLLKPGETAVIDLPEEATEYYIVECGVDPKAYDEVKVLGTPISGSTDEHDPALKNYPTAADTMTNRPEVKYDNHVADGARGTLSITKKLYDTNGTTVLTRDDDPTPFDFRLFLGNSTTNEEELPRADHYPYFVKDPSGHYCRWNVQAQQFDPLPYTEYDALSAYLEGLTATERESIVFRTSMYGSISMIPTGYTAEVRDLVIGTRWRAEEWDSEIPKGYTLRLDDGYTRTDRGSEEKNGTTPISGTMKENEDPKIEIRNQKGWGLTVEKVWTDKDFMERHDPIYFAVYLRKEASGTQPESFELLPGSVRELTTDQDSIYYFFGDLRADIPFANYWVFEVTADKSLDPEGKPVYTNVRRITEGGTLTIGGKPVGGSYQDSFEYTVSYERGEQTTQNENVRTDVVTNSRPGIKIFKTEWDYVRPLSDAVFTLKDAEGLPVAAETYTSESSGLVTIAYLNPGTDGSPAVYELEETASPRGFMGAEYPLQIMVDADGNVTVSDPPQGYGAGYYQFIPAKKATETEPAEMAAIIVRNREAALEVLKTDPSEDPEKLLEGVHFALYRQVTDAQGNKRKDYQPMPGYEDLVTGPDGKLKEISIDDPDLVWGNTYYLTETQAAPGYDRLDQDLCFTIRTDGTVTVDSEGHGGWLSFTDVPDGPGGPDAGKRTWRITIPNGKVKKVSFMKVDIEDPVDSRLDGAEFDLYRVIGGVREDAPYLSGLVSGGAARDAAGEAAGGAAGKATGGAAGKATGGAAGKAGMLAKDGRTIFELPKGVYHLVETKAPDGYQLRATAVVITVTGEADSEDKDFVPGSLNGVNYKEGTVLSSDGSGEKYEADTQVYTLKISNATGRALPSTGGSGTRCFTLAGLLLMAAAVLMYLKLRIRRA